MVYDKGADRNRSFEMAHKHAHLNLSDAISAEKLWHLVLTHGHVGGSGLGLSPRGLGP